MRGKRPERSSAVRILEISERSFFEHYTTPARYPLESEITQRIYDAYLSIRTEQLGLFKHYFLALVVCLAINIGALTKLPLLDDAVPAQFWAHAALGYLTISNFSLAWLNARSRVLFCFFRKLFDDADHPGRNRALLLFPHAYPPTYFMPLSILGNYWAPIGHGWITSKSLPALLVGVVPVLVLVPVAGLIWPVVNAVWATRGAVGHGLPVLFVTSAIAGLLTGATSKRPVRYEYFGMEYTLMLLGRSNAGRAKRFKALIETIKSRP